MINRDLSHGDDDLLGKENGIGFWIGQTLWPSDGVEKNYVEIEKDKSQ